MESLRVPGTIEALPAVAAWVDRAAELAGLDEQAAYGLRLAVDEIATNVIVHGYQKAGLSGELVLMARVEDDRLTVELVESSPPYDPRQTPAPDDLDRPPDKRRVGGLGVFLARQGVDSFDYEIAEGFNRHTFVMNRTC
jgi:phosphoserine phosphatase RsbU/P